MSAARRVVAAIGWLLLGAAAILGLALSSLALLASVPFGRAAVASVVVRVADDAIAGGVELEGIEVLPGGVIELRGLRIFDPHGHLVLAVGRARLSADVTALRSRRIGLEVELERPSVLVEEEADGGISLVRAFGSSRPSPEPARREGPAEPGEGSGWIVHLSRIAIRAGEVWWVDAEGETRLEAGGLDVAARGTIGPRRSRAEIRLRGALHDPVESPLAIDLVAARAGPAVRVPVLELDAGGTSVSAVADGNLVERRGRVAITRLGISRDQARALLPSAPDGADLGATGFAESDGTTVTAAVTVVPAAGGGAPGHGRAAVAARLGALGRAAGFDVSLDRLDPSRLAASAPGGELTLAGRGAVAGSSLEDARAHLALTVARSRLRGGEITRAEVQLRAVRGRVEVDRLSAAAPGLTTSGSGRWTRNGPVAGRVSVEAADLAVATRNVARLLGGAAPAVGGRVRLAAELSGTAEAPALSGTLESSSLLAGGVVADGLRLSVRGSRRAGSVDAEAEGTMARLRAAGGRELARGVTLRARVRGEEGTLTARGDVPGAGTEPLAIEARGRLGARRETLLLAQLALAWPGARWGLAAPATVTLRGPSVDRLELVADGQRVVLSGGLGARGALAARAELTAVDLARLPPGVLPAEEGVRGRVSASLDAAGTAARPSVSGRVAVEDGAWRNLAGLSAQGDVALDGAARRASGSLAIARADGGTLDVAADLPVPLAGRGAEPVRVRVRAASLPVAQLVAAARSDAPAAGTLALDVRVDGTAGGPTLGAEVTLADGAWRDLDGLGATLELEAARGALLATTTWSLAGRPALDARAEVPLDLAEVAARPAETLGAIVRAPLQASANLTSLDLAAVAGRAGVPSGVAGTVTGRADVEGSAAAPRGTVALDVADAAVRGWRRMGSRLQVSAGPRGLSASGAISAAGTEALRFEASLAIDPERLSRREALGAAALRVEAVIPRVALGTVAGEALPVTGTLEGRLTAAGTPRAPEVTFELAGSGVSIEARPLGDGRVTARYGRGRGDAELVLRPSSGGSLRAAIALTADLGLRAGGPPLGDAPAEVSVIADALDLGFLPALAPATIRSAGGTLAGDVRAQGPLARLSPRGTLRVDKGRLAVAELGEWTDIAVEARVTEDVVELSRLDVRRGSGRLSATAALRGARSGTARLTAKLGAEGFTVARAGMDLATFDLAAEATGSWQAGELAMEVTVPRGVIRLPRRQPRALQSLERRKDIVVGRPRKRPAPAAAAAGAAPLSVRAHVVVPRNLFVKSDNPKLDVELKADVRYELTGGEDYAEGTIEVVRGTVEPLAGRTFVLERGRVQFTGGPPRAALLDVEARYQNPAAVVTVNVSGAATSPEIRLTSQPPMDEAQIAMLIATGRTELKAGTGAVGTLTGEEAGRAALGALATQAFRNLVQDKLPLDTVALDSGELRAGKYLTDKIYVGYIRRFDADPTRNENENEVRVEYQITPRWMFESRYGNAQSGGASLIWSRDY